MSAPQARSTVIYINKKQAQLLTQTPTTPPNPSGKLWIPSLNTKKDQNKVLINPFPWHNITNTTISFAQRWEPPTQGVSNNPNPTQPIANKCFPTSEYCLCPQSTVHSGAPRILIPPPAYCPKSRDWIQPRATRRPEETHTRHRSVESHVLFHVVYEEHGWSGRRPSWWRRMEDLIAFSQ